MKKPPERRGIPTSPFGRTPEGRAFDPDLRESAQRLHEIVGNVDPVVFEAYLTMGRTWDSLRRMGEKYYANLGLTPYQRHSLRFLLIAQDNRLTIGDLANQLETTSVNTTKLVNRMQRSSLVRRETDSIDRRVIWVVLTELGKDKYLRALPISASDIEVFSALSRDERTLLIDLLSRIQEKVLELSENQLGNVPQATNGVHAG